MTSQKIIIGITAGDPKGVGPEIVAKILQDPELRDAAEFKIFGVLDQNPWQISDSNAAKQTLQSLQEATAAALEGSMDALVTAPVNKARLHSIDPTFI